MSVTDRPAVARDLSEPLKSAYDGLLTRRATGESPEEMRAYAASLDGALTPEEHRSIDRWIEAEASEPVRRRWRLPGLHERLAAEVVRDLSGP